MSIRHALTPERVLSFVVTITAALAVSVVALLLLVPDTPRPQALGDFTSPAVLNQVRDPEPVRPLLQPGEPLLLLAVRCVTRDTEVLSFRTFQRVDVEPGKREAASGEISTTERKKGETCEPTEIKETLPTSVQRTGGIWTMTGIDVALADGSVRIFSTPEFEVVPASPFVPPLAE